MQFLNSNLNSIFMLSTAAALSRAALLGREVIAASTLTVPEFGHWALVLMVYAYSLHAPLGYQNLLSRDLPVANAKHDKSSAYVMQSSTFSVYLITAILLAAASLAWNPGGLNPAILGLGILAQQLFGFGVVVTKAKEQFALYNSAVIVQSAAASFLGVWFSGEYRVNGLAVGAAIGWLIGALILFTPQKKQVFFGKYQQVSEYLFKALPAAFRCLISSGFILMITTLDKLVVSIAYDASTFGKYSSAGLLFSVVTMLGFSIQTAFYPKWMKSDLESPKSKLKLRQNLIIYIPVILVAAAVCLIYLGRYVLPLIKAEFSDSYLVAMSLVPIFLVAQIVGGVNLYLISIRREKFAMLFNLAFLVSISPFVIIALSSGELRVSLHILGLGFAAATVAAAIALRKSDSDLANLNPFNIFTLAFFTVISLVASHTILVQPTYTLVVTTTCFVLICSAVFRNIMRDEK